MSLPQHTILFLASEHSESAQNRMGKEHSEIREEWRRSNHRDEFTMDTAMAADTKSLRNKLLDLPESGQHVLHFVGSTDQGICLPNASNQGPNYLDPNALSGVMQLFDNITAVVMSGCYEERQARALSSIGSPGKDFFVVGIKSDLPPDQRISISVGVYAALCSGRGAAFMAKFIKSVPDLEGIPAEKLIVWANGKILGQQERPAQPKWDDSERKKPLTDEHVFFCNREKQDQRFVEIMPETRDLSFAFFGVHGDDPQSHAGLVKRLFRYYLCSKRRPEESAFTQVQLREASSLAKYQSEIKAKFLTAFDCGDALFESEADQWQELLEYFQEQKKKKVVVEFRVRSPHWKEFTPDLIRWFIQDYCKPEYLGPNAPRFFFFLSIVYEDRADHQIMLSEIRKMVTRLPSAEVLEELRPVTQNHIREWIQEYMDPNPEQREAYLKEICHDQLPSYDMADIELRLNRFIQTYSLQDPDF